MNEKDREFVRREGETVYGYVRPFVPELKVAEYERYRAVYCGLCRSMGRVTGQLSRISLSYDFTFFAAVRMALEGVVPKFAPVRCPAHPMRKRPAVEENPSLAFSAAVSALFAGEKTRDDLSDERGLLLLKPLLQRPLTEYMERRAEKSGLLPQGCGARVSELLSRLGEAEKARCPSADETAGLFGEVLAYAFSLGLEGEAAEDARIFGRGAGRFVYLCDAAADLAEDAKRGRYNPLAVGWGDLALEDGKLSPLVRDSLSSAVPLTLEEMGRAADRLDPSHPLTPILKNIVYLGLPAMLRRVLSGEKNAAEEREPGKERFGSL